MRSASVGFQCPECVSEGAKSVRVPRTAFGGRVSMDTSRITQVLIGLNVAVFLLGSAVPNLDLRFGNLALAQDGLGGLIGVANGQYYRLITAAFLHAGLLHILFNMFALAQLGPILEPALGRARFLALYLLSALGGSTMSYWLSSPGQLGVGASGAIFGLFGAYYIVVRRLGGETGPIVVLLVINGVISLTPGIDWRAHLGGLITGAVIAAAFAYLPRGPRQGVQHAAVVAGVAILLAVAVVVRTTALTG
jgi:membrane associated rhomboid family serine protease